MNRFKCLQTLSLAVFLLTSFSGFHPLVAQDQFKRTVNSGDWNDGHWQDQNGVEGGTPGQDDDVSIGETTDTNDTDVDVTDSQSAHKIDVNRGTLKVLAGGSLTANRLNLNSSNATAIFQGDYSSNNIIDSKQGTVTIDGGTVSPYGIWMDGGVLNLISGTLTGDLSLSDYQSGNAVTVNQTGTVLDLREVTIAGGSQLTINANDSISKRITLVRGATLTVNRDLNLTHSVAVTDSTFHLNGNLSVEVLNLFGASAVLQRSGGG